MKQILHILLVLCAVCWNVVVSSSTEDTCKPYGYSKSSLLMDVQWVLQGTQINFHGFTVEFLGISSAFQKLLPFGRLVKSTFLESFTESPVVNHDRFFNQDLFPKERDSMLSIMSEEHPHLEKLSTEYSEATRPTSRFLPEAKDATMFCNPPNDLWEVGVTMVGGDLSKNSYVDAEHIQSPRDCCMVCSSLALCNAWSFDKSSNTCHLKGMRTTNMEPGPEMVSGKMVGVDPTTNARTGIAPKPRAIIFHGTTCIVGNQSVHHIPRDANTIYIGRYMLERSSLAKGATMDEYAVIRCAQIMDELWVPTQWHKEVFQKLLRQHGASSLPPIEIVPEAVDTELFQPKEISSFEVIVSETGEQVTKGFSNHPTIQKGCIMDVEGRVICQPTKNFEFLSIFKWEYRKGWDVLLLAYWQAFSREDNVVLRLRTYVPKFDRSGTLNITQRMEEHAYRVLGKSLQELPKVVLEEGSSVELRSDAMTRAQVKDLLASADAFVLPTRGEGWGLPISEAMSMALPVIITNCTGQMAYATEENSYLIPIEDELDEWSFAKPSIGNLRATFRKVILDSTESNGFVAQQKGLQARETMKRISAESIVCKMNDRLRYHADRRGWEM